MSAPSEEMLKERFDALLYRQSHPDEYPDRMETVRMFGALAEEGYAPAQLKMAGFLFAMKKPEEGLTMLDKACAQNFPAAISSKGVCYYRGSNGLEQSYEKARQYYERAAMLEDKDAILNLGLMYMEGEGCEKDDFEAAEQFRKLTLPGEEDVDACFHLGCLCIEGKVGRSDQTRAEGMVLLTEAARGGHPGAKELVQANYMNLQAMFNSELRK